MDIEQVLFFFTHLWTEMGLKPRSDQLTVNVVFIDISTKPFFVV